MHSSTAEDRVESSESAAPLTDSADAVETTVANEAAIEAAPDIRVGPHTEASGPRPSLVIRAWRSLARIFTAYPLRVERHAMANLRALAGGPTVIAEVARRVYDEIHGSGVEPTLEQQADARQAFTLLARVGAIACTKRRKSDGSWAEVTLTPLGRDVLEHPEAWFIDGYLLRARQRRAR